MIIHFESGGKIDIQDYTYHYKVVGIEVCIYGIRPTLSVDLNTFDSELSNIVFTVSKFSISRKGILGAGELAHKLSRHFQAPITQRMKLSI